MKHLTPEDRQVLKELQKLPNIGPACAQDLLLLGIRNVSDLKGRTADDLYGELCAKTGSRQDPCVWDTFASVVHYAQTGERKKWWEFTPIRKSGPTRL
jgi:hypothetical protein